MFLSFQDIIFTLQKFWADNNCIIMQSYDVEMGAGTFHPATIKSIISQKFNVAFVQPSRRPADTRVGGHPNRWQKYYQFQVILQPSPDNAQELYLNSLKILGIDCKNNDIRFVEDNWASPTLAAAGKGWEVWCNGMEISQFTYFQNFGGNKCYPVPVEITYGLERLALYIQNVEKFNDIIWHNNVTYQDIEYNAEQQFSDFNIRYTNIDFLTQQFELFEKQVVILLQQELSFPAYDYVLKINHIFNLLDARNALSVTERAKYIARIRELSRNCINLILKQQS